MPGIELYDALIERASKTDPLAEIACDHIAKRTEEMRRAQMEIATIQKQDSDNGHYVDMSGAELQKRLLGYVNNEIEAMKLFDAARGSVDPTKMPFAIRYHKMGVILPLVKKRFEAEEGDSYCSRLAEGSFNPDASFHVTYPVLQTPTYWGSNEGTLKSAEMMCLRFATTEETIETYADTSLAHITPAPSSLLAPCFEGLSSKFFSIVQKYGEEATFGFGAVHGGYFFGGQRGEDNQNVYGPEDCSSFVDNCLTALKLGKKYGEEIHKTQFSTNDLLFAWRIRRAQQFLNKGKEISFYIQRTPDTESCLEILDKPVTITKKKGHPGLIYAYRCFNKSTGGDPDRQAGSAGHTGVVVGRDPETPSKVVLAHCSRDMERENPEKGIWGCAGMGFSSFDMAGKIKLGDDREKHTLFLKHR